MEPQLRQREGRGQAQLWLDRRVEGAKVVEAVLRAVLRAALRELRAEQVLGVTRGLGVAGDADADTSRVQLLLQIASGRLGRLLLGRPRLGFAPRPLLRLAARLCLRLAPRLCLRLTARPLLGLVACPLLRLAARLCLRLAPGQFLDFAPRWDVLQRLSRVVRRVPAAVARERLERLPTARGRDDRLAGGVVLGEAPQRPCRLLLRLRAASPHERQQRHDAALAPDFLLGGVAVVKGEVTQRVCRLRPLPIAPRPQPRNPMRNVRVRHPKLATTFEKACGAKLHARKATRGSTPPTHGPQAPLCPSSKGAAAGRRATRPGGRS